MAEKRKNRRRMRRLRRMAGLPPALVRRRPRRSRPGAAPGTLVFHEDAEPTRLHLIAYGPAQVDERDVESVAEARAATDDHAVVWLDVVGLGTEATIRALGEEFGVHRLVLEDVLNTHQRAKVEVYPHGLFCVVRMPVAETAETEQVSVLLSDGVLITVQERPGDVFEAVRERIRIPRGIIRENGCDYLLYAIVDAVIDSYFPVLDSLGDRLVEIEEEVMAEPTQDTVTRLHRVRRELIGLRKAAWPHRDMVNTLIRDTGDVIAESTGLYLRDAYDHAIQIMDLTDSMRDLAGDLLSTYMSVVSNRMNEVMKVLTIIATLFIPLSFVAGLYGMNFDPSASRWNMPELGWAYGYPAALAVMALMAVGLLSFFRRKGWL